MPAAAVIPAPIAYIKVVAVKKLVVGSRAPAVFPAPLCRHAARALDWVAARRPGRLLYGIPRTRVRVPVEMHVFHISSIEKIRVLKAGGSPE